MEGSKEKKEVRWYSQEAVAVAEHFQTTAERGLDAATVNAHRARYGLNVLQSAAKKTYLGRFIDQLKDAMILILLVAAGISFALGEKADAVIIIGIVVLNALFGVFQEAKAEESLEALKRLSSPHARVLRDGEIVQIDAAELVPGDLFLLEAGDLVPADGRLIETASLRVEESSLTGESTSVEKNTAPLPDENLGVGDRKNMVFSSSVIAYGRGRAIAVATGMDAEVGKIAGMLLAAEEGSTPLQKKLASLGKILGAAALGVCALIFAIGAFQGRNLFEMFFVAVSLAVAAIPEGLPAIVTIVLAVGVKRMVAKHAIIRKLPAVESLGSASVICSDKTGTLTQNKMTVMEIATASKSYHMSDNEELREILKLAALCCDASVRSVDGVETSVGDPTEVALVSAALKLGLKKDVLEQELVRVEELPFDSNRKLMTTIHRSGDAFIAITKGAPDVLFKRCTHVLEGGVVVPITDALRTSMEAQNETMAGRALRVIAVAYQNLTEIPEILDADRMEQNLIFAGMTGMIDPPRMEVKAAVLTCRTAGIRPVMITGDHKTTAVAIARELGILTDKGLVATGSDLDSMNQETLELGVEDIAVYARVSPEHKVRIVSAWQSRGYVVAMTGDGVNDAPALKKADIGCAMGITGTDVSKGAADMILTDDNFATIVDAVKEGRGIYQNIRKAVHFLLSCNLAEIFVLFIAILLNWDTPLLPIHLLWVNLVTDSLLALALGMEDVERDIMRHPPRSPKEGFFSDGLGGVIFVQGILIAAVTLIAFRIGMAVSVEVARTSTFAVLALSQLVHAWNVRSSKSLFSIGFFSNPWMTRAFFASLSLQLLVLFVPQLQKIFKVVSLDAAHWGYIVLLSLAPLVFVELGKAALGRNKRV